jgi:hypothetical protein
MKRALMMVLAPRRAAVRNQVESSLGHILQDVYQVKVFRRSGKHLVCIQGFLCDSEWFNPGAKMLVLSDLIDKVLQWERVSPVAVVRSPYSGDAWFGVMVTVESVLPWWRRLSPPGWRVFVYGISVVMVALYWALGATLPAFLIALGVGAGVWGAARWFLWRLGWFR